MNFTVSALSRQTLFVSLNIDETAEGALTLPANNFSAAQILGHLLDAKLEAAGEGLQPANVRGSLNHCFCICVVRDANAAFKIIRAALEQVGLAPFTCIYRFDEAELIYRNLFPATGQDINLEGLKRLLEACENLNEPALSQLKEFERRRQAAAPDGTDNPS